LSVCEECRADGKEGELKRLIWARAATDLRLFASYYFPHFCTDPFNEFHLDGFAEAVFGERLVRRARGAPRGYAKSTQKALIKVLHDICYKLERFIVVLSNTETQTIQKLRDIRNEVLTNLDLAGDFKLRFPTAKVNESEFVVLCGDYKVKVQGFSAGAQVRGIRFGPHRPTKIVLDDVEHSEEVFNEALRRKRELWYHEDVVKAGAKDVNIEFIGTVLHRDSLLKNIAKNPMYSGRIYRAVLSWSEREDLWEKWRTILRNIDNERRHVEAQEFYEANEAEMLRGTRVLWPERESYLFLMKEMLEIGRSSFMKEKQNEPLGAEDKVFGEFRWYREELRVVDGKEVPGLAIEQTNVFIPLDRMNAYGALDPATGQTKARKGKLGDFTCLLTGYTDSKNRLFVHRDWTRRAPPTQYIKEIFEHHGVYDFQKFGVETNLYRNLLLPNIVAERERYEKKVGKKVRVSFYDVDNLENKEKRIYTLEPKVTNGWILFNRALSQEFMNQMEDFPHADHDDCPDALEMLWGLVNNRYKMADVSVNPMAGR
jgi:predicted phage terminase large subunit-like protein